MTFAALGAPPKAPPDLLPVRFRAVRDHVLLTSPFGDWVFVTPDEMRFGPGRVPGHEIAPLIGASNTPGAYVERVRFPANAISQAHSHPEERTYTILSGTWYVGYGDTYDPARLKAWPTSPACRQASAMCRSKRERRGSRGLIDSACR